MLRSERKLIQEFLRKNLVNCDKFLEISLEYM